MAVYILIHVIIYVLIKGQLEDEQYEKTMLAPGISIVKNRKKKPVYKR